MLNSLVDKLQGAAAAAVLPRQVPELPKTGKYAYVTLLTRDPYLPGVIALLWSLRKVETKYPVVCIVTPDVTRGAREEIERYGGIIREYQRFIPFEDNHNQFKEFLANAAQTYWIDCWSKFHMWELTEYAKGVYLDADVCVYKNLDHLFDLPNSFYAVRDCYNGGDPEDKARGFYHDPEKCFYSSSCPDKIPHYFNAGFYVFTPSMETANAMKESARKIDVAGLTFQEQDFMNMFFQGQWEADALPYSYNAIKWFARYHNHAPYEWSDVHVLHYVTEKPWKVGRIDRSNPEHLRIHHQHLVDEFQGWWDLFIEAMHARAGDNAAAMHPLLTQTLELDSLSAARISPPSTPEPTTIAPLLTPSTAADGPSGMGGVQFTAVA